MLAQGIYALRPALPTVIGNEGVGRVLAVGPGVESVKVGDRVLAPLSSFTWRERMVISANGLFALPPDADPQQLAMLAINPPTAALLLSEYVDLKPGEWVVQNAANSGVGRWVIAFAKTRGLKTVNIVRRPELVAVGREVGANPTNSMANAIEIGFNAPTRRNPKPAVITKPTVKVMATARTSRHERKASQRMASTVSPVTVLLKAKPFLTLANSSSDIGTGPVRRTFA